MTRFDTLKDTSLHFLASPYAKEELQKSWEGREDAVEMSFGKTAKSIDAVPVSAVYRDAKISLGEIYRYHKRNTTMIFAICIISIVITLVIAIVLIFPDILRGDFTPSKSFEAFSLVVGAFPTFLAGSSFYLYNKGLNTLEKIERDLTKLANLEALLSLAERMDNVELQEKMMNSIIEKMKG